MKRRILIVTESLQMNGVLGSLLGFLSALPQDCYEVELMAFNPKIPSWVALPKYVHFISAPTACRVAVVGLREAIGICLTNRQYGMLVRRLAYALAERFLGVRVKDRLISTVPQVAGSWDVACAYSMGKIGYFVYEKVSARKKVLWIHTDPLIPELAKDWKRYQQLAPEVAGVVCVSEGVAEKARRDIPDKVFCVHNVVDVEGIVSKSRLGSSKPKIDGVIRLVTVGRFCKVKNQHLIPAIAKEIIRRGYRIEWYMIGPGANKWKVDGFDGVLYYLESMTNPQAMIASADICVQLSRYEGWGLALTEGLVLGRYSIASDIPSFRDQIRDDRVGKLVPISVKSFADAICDAIESGKISAPRAPYVVPWTAENTVREFERIIS